MKIYGSTVRYVPIDPRDLMGEEDLLDEVAGELLSLMDYSGVTLDEAAKICIDYYVDIVEQSKRDIQSGSVKSIYDR